MLQSCRTRSIDAIAAAAAFATAGDWFDNPSSSARLSRSPRALITSTAASRSASLVSSEYNAAAARACSMRDFTPVSVSFAMALSSAGNAVGSCEWNTASAAVSRVAGSAANSRRLPNAASTAPRTGLFIRTCFSALAITSGAGLPLAASTKVPSSCLMNSTWSARANSRPPCNATMIGRERGSPDSVSCSIPCRMVSKLGDARAASASSDDWARAS